MCGIAGTWQINDFVGPSREVVNNIIGALTHRGPDASGLWSNQDETICLGHRRLSIQDLSSSGAQPMSSRSGRLIVVFNGEIYNFRKLSDELIHCGIVFAGHSDTEVLVEAFDYWGVEETVQKLTGMFAIALYDTSAEKLWLIRDRLGEKPLYIYRFSSGILFSSELNALVSSTNKKHDLDDKEIEAYFRYGYFSVSSTPFNDICKLKPGCMICIDKSWLISSNQKINDVATSYWDNSSINFNKNSYKNDKVQDNKVINEFEDRFLGILEDQSVADVELGVFLSGGIDSSLVAGCLQSISEKPIKTFTVAFENEEYNEAPFAKEVATAIGSEHIEVALSIDDCLHTVEELPMLLDEPFADASIIPTYLVCREARKHVTVCLSGDGGDELFGGYNRYINGNKIWSQVKPVPGFVRAGLGSIINIFPLHIIDKLYHLLSTKIENKTKSEKDIGNKIHKIAGLLKSENSLDVYISLMSFWQESPFINTLGLSKGFYEGNQKSCFDEDFISCAMINDQNFYLPCDNLFKVDRAAMANSLEVRIPLLDHELVKYANSLPIEYKVRNGVSKWLLRQVLYKYVPRKLIERPKMGFSMPLKNWLKNELKSWAYKYISEKDLLFSAGLDFVKVDNIWNMHQRGQRDYSNAIWSLITYLIWYKKNLEFIS